MPQHNALAASERNGTMALPLGQRRILCWHYSEGADKSRAARACSLGSACPEQVPFYVLDVKELDQRLSEGEMRGLLHVH
eukprot:6210959-Pleurochrysis_carterae.AAC.1